jgi:predicted metal-dependent hydrolase
MNLFNPQRHADGDLIEVAGAQVRLRVDARARRVSLRLDSARRQVVATAPTARRLPEAVAFARQRSAWIAGLMGDLPQPVDLTPGAIIEVLGKPCVLEAGAGRARLIDGEVMRLVAPAGERFPASVMRVLRAQAKRVLSERTEAHARALGQALPVVTIMDARGRWGSCKQPRRSGFGAGAEVGRIRYSWRLVLCPYAVMDYVAAHECAHLVEANHGPRFWAVCRGLAGDERPHRKWLRANAQRLHAFAA